MKLPRQIKDANDLRLVRLRDARSRLGHGLILAQDIPRIITLLVDDAIELGELLRTLEAEEES